MTRLGVLVNPASGRGLGAKAGPVVIAALRSAGHEVVDLTAPDVVSARARTATFLLEGGVDALIAVGGDGVVNLASNAVLTHAPAVPIGLWPRERGTIRLACCSFRWVTTWRRPRI